MNLRPSQQTWNERMEVVGKGVGLLLVLGGLAMYFITDRAEPVVFTAGVALFLGGAGVGLGRSGRDREPPKGDVRE